MIPFRVQPNDLKAQEEILALLHAAFAYMDGRIDPPSSLHNLTVKKIADHAQTHEIWAIGTPIIACMFLRHDEDALYLGKLAVAENHRGLGVSRVLVNLAEQRAHALFYDRLELQSRIELTEVHAAFRTMGFQKTGEDCHPGHAHPTEITMQKRV